MDYCCAAIVQRQVAFSLLCGRVWWSGRGICEGGENQCRICCAEFAFSAGEGLVATPRRVRGWREQQFPSLLLVEAKQAFMEGIRPGVEANFGVAAGQAKWRALLAANYFTFPLRDQRCPLCHAARLLSCGNHFCMECNVGGLCRAQFRAGGDHGNHADIQVYKVTHELALRVDDLKEKNGNPGLLNVGQLHRLQKYSENKNLHCKFFGPNAEAFVGGRRCRGCGFGIAETSTPNISTHPVCSIKCLLDYALVERREAERMLAAARQRAAARELAAAAHMTASFWSDYSKFISRQ